MLREGRVDRVGVREYFESIAPDLYRYPAIDAASFREAVDRALGSP